MRTVFIRSSRDMKAGRTDMAHVRVRRISDNKECYLGEVSGHEVVFGALEWAHLTTEDPWEWVESVGYQQVPSEGI